MGLKPKAHLPGQVSIKLAYRRIGCWTGAGRTGNFFFVGNKMPWELEVADWRVGWVRVE